MSFVHRVLRWSDCNRFFANNRVSRLVFYGVHRASATNHAGGRSQHAVTPSPHYSTTTTTTPEAHRTGKDDGSPAHHKKHRRENQAPKLCSVDVYAKNGNLQDRAGVTTGMGTVSSQSEVFHLVAASRSPHLPKKTPTRVKVDNQPRCDCTAPITLHL